MCAGKDIVKREVRGEEGTGRPSLLFVRVYGNVSVYTTRRLENVLVMEYFEVLVAFKISYHKPIEFISLVA